MSRSIAITGGAGFVGLALAEALRQQGDRVTLLDLAPPDPQLFARPELAGTRYLPCDILDEALLRHSLAESGAELIVHAAAITPNGETSQARALTIAEVNVTGALRLLAAAQATGIRDVVLLSSISVYGALGGGAVELREDAPATPDTLYGETKLAAEMLCARIAPTLGLRLATLRLGPLFGPWESLREARPDLSPHAQLRQLSARGTPVRLAHEMRGDWIYSRDAAAMIAAVTTRMDTAAGGCFNIAGGAPFALTDWARAMGLPAPTLTPDTPDIAPRADPRRGPMSTAAIAALTGIDGGRSMTEAVADEMAWLASWQETRA
ncbi:NAD-dependent epimerase/dehydratase family protein [Pseudooceanicola marinus]|uniref:NAD-dependent epimerase/dehydratase family protein n=1 Tax=Pseudooceanicola marinus TaxID=396013 RepID=UPI001CD3391E|nr:NAD(P)-dependent oxidoreductase [Pseudooceanicola marinus]MCA1337490.1 NAD(P)-dependent oxidoreductase [Pseudooceanicola marinus]